MIAHHSDRRRWQVDRLFGDPGLRRIGSPHFGTPAASGSFRAEIDASLLATLKE
jgi:hypothetical protein